ncbi:MAG: hypothetical protein ACLFTH_00735 [Candidatus Woesearchaeota archaeon]
MVDWLITLIIIFLAFLIGSLPLHLAAKAFGGETTIIKSIIVNVLAGLIAAVVASFVPVFATILAFIVLLFVYKFAFRIGWLRALAVWALQIVITIVLTALAAGFGLVSLSGMLAV